MKAPTIQLVDTLVLADRATIRIVSKTLRVVGRTSYAIGDSLATTAGWEGEPTGKRSSRVRGSWREINGDQVLIIEFTTER
jgi:hypothetical protein